jgi:hypothetical protein
VIDRETHRPVVHLSRGPRAFAVLKAACGPCSVRIVLTLPAVSKNPHSSVALA